MTRQIGIESFGASHGPCYFILKKEIICNEIGSREEPRYLFFAHDLEAGVLLDIFVSSASS